MKEFHRGHYIVIEGADATGKSKHAIELTNYIETELHRPVLRVFNDETGANEPIQEPGGTSYANQIRHQLKDGKLNLSPQQQVDLFTDARVSNWNELMKPALEDGATVVTARNYLSTIAYQGYGFGYDQQSIVNTTRERVGESYVRPDVLCVLALTDEVERRRRLKMASRKFDVDQDRFESQPDDFQMRMQKGYLELAGKFDATLIDSTPPPNQVQASIRNLYHEKTRVARPLETTYIDLAKHAHQS